MYQCPHCSQYGISAMAVFSGKNMPVKCSSRRNASYRKLPLIGELILSAVLTVIGFTLILAKGAPLLVIAGLAGIVLGIAAISHWFGKMTVLGVLMLVVVLSAASTAANEPPVFPSTPWIKRVAAKTPVTALNLSANELAGQWVNEGPLSGSYLNLFPDGTFIYTEAADIMPETIYDKGIWRAESGMLTLSPDPDVKWDPKRDRHFLMLRPQASEPEPMLFGVDRKILVFEHLVAADPKSALDALVFSSLRRKGAWTEGEASQVKARLGKDSEAWRPCWFTDAGCPRGIP